MFTIFCYYCTSVDRFLSAQTDKTHHQSYHPAMTPQTVMMMMMTATHCPPATQIVAQVKARLLLFLLSSSGVVICPVTMNTRGMFETTYRWA